MGTRTGKSLSSLIMVYSLYTVFSRLFAANYSKTCIKQLISRRSKIGFQDQLSLNAGQYYCRMLQGEHSAILPTFIKLPFVIKTFVLSIFEWQFYTDFTVVLEIVDNSNRQTCYYCLTDVLLLYISVLWLFLMVLWDGLQCVIVVFPDHTHLIFDQTAYKPKSS